VNPLNDIEPVDWLIDIGVDKPNSEAWHFKKAFPDINIVGVDPNPSHAAMSAIFPGTFISKACSSYDGILTMNAEPKSPTERFLIVSKTKESNAEHEIPCVTIDTLDRTHNFSNALLWLDVEGHELEILKGSTNTLENKITYVFCELRSKSPYSYITDWCDDISVINILDKAGFELIKKYGVRTDNTDGFNYTTYDGLFARKEA
jgi:FkbM family methyltransferase